MNGGTVGPGARGIKDRTKSLHQGSGWHSAAVQFLNVKFTRACNCKKILALNINILMLYLKFYKFQYFVDILFYLFQAHFIFFLFTKIHWFRGLMDWLKVSLKPNFTTSSSLVLLYDFDLPVYKTTLI